MKVRKIPVYMYFLFIALFMVGCNNDSENSDPPIEENTIAEYSLTFRGQTSTWTDEDASDADFSLHQFSTEAEGYYTLNIVMSHMTASASQSNGINISGLVGNKKIETGTINPVTYSLVHVHTYAEVKNCFEERQACMGLGVALVSGTEPPVGSGAPLPGIDNDIHSESGTLTITGITITQNKNGIIKGRISGNFSLSGINTNGSKPNPGSASGSFENAPFEMLAF